LGNEAIVTGIVARGEEVAVETEEAARLVELELAPSPLGDFDDGVDNARFTGLGG
jgi:hypothetical protein